MADEVATAGLEPSAWLAKPIADHDFDWPDGALCEVKKEAITSHGKMTAIAKSRADHREKITWNRGR